MSELHRGRSSFQSCMLADLGFRPRNPLEASGWYGRIASPPGLNNAACAAKSAKSSQLCGDANYSRVHAQGEPLHTQRFAVFHSPFVISKSETESWEFSKGDAGAMPTIIGGELLLRDNVILISKVWVNISQFSLSREDWYIRIETLRFGRLLLLISILYTNELIIASSRNRVS